ncbi:hypothetical protein CYG49_05030 [Candidatus Saccharibacteria bacterium]|nr:MAG: hypothetical protein CYG49_05030 [Candidatus Saccharibacteria bacterium]
MRVEHSSSEGFSIVELIVTLTVATIAVVIILSMHATAGRLTDRSTDLLAANEIAFAKLQEIENKPFSSIESGPVDTPKETNFDSQVPTSLPSPRIGRTYVSSPTPTLKYVLVRVKYGQGVGEKVVEYGTYIQEGGLGR